MSTKIWIVSEYGWEFDDSKYYKPEYCGSTPQTAFTIKELAEKICEEKNIGFVRKNCGFSGYVEPDDIEYNADYTDECESYEEFCEKYRLDSLNLSFCEEIEKISDETILKLMSILGVSFYEVVSVELLA